MATTATATCTNVDCPRAGVECDATGVLPIAPDVQILCGTCNRPCDLVVTG